MAASDEQVGRLALQRELISPAQLREALAEQAREVAAGRPQPRALSNILVTRGFLSPAQLTSLQGPAAQEPERYVVQGEIARGGMGAVLKAEDQRIRRAVAMKVMLRGDDETGRLRFVEEAQVTGQLEHPNIVPVHELGTDPEGRPFFTMKLVKGRSLAQVLKALREGDAAAVREYGHARLLGVFVNVCNAMAFAHSKGVVHRDLKPANLMLGDFGEVLVMDWGLAKLGAAVRPKTDRIAKESGKVPLGAVDLALEEMVRSLRQDTPESLTMDGAVMGTPHYMPPEQAMGEIARIDARSDVYSLGAILYEILTLKPPVEAKGVQELLLKVVEGRIQRPELRAPGRTVPPELSAVAMKALATKPADRYPDVLLLKRDIELFLEGRAVSAKADSPWETLVKLVKRNRAASAAVLGAAVVVSITVGTGYTVAVKERDVARSALASFKSEQELRLRQQKESAPALLTTAMRSVTTKDWDAALQQAEAAAAFDPDLAEARLLGAELLAARKDFARAAEVADAYAKLRPDDPNGPRLRDICREASKAVTTAVATSFREHLAARGQHELATRFAADQATLLSSYRAALQKAWPKVSLGRFTMNPDGTCVLWIPDSGVTDLAPLKGLPLVNLVAYNNPIADLSPLRGMPITNLHLGSTEVADLGPLKGMNLEGITLPRRVVDLRPLRGMLLKRLDIYNSEVRDLSPLVGMPLRDLSLPSCKDIADFSPLRGLPLNTLELRGTSIQDLSVLKGAPLTNLGLQECSRISDLSVLESLPLEHLTLPPLAGVKNLDPVRRNRTLKKISLSHDLHFETAMFWERFDSGSFYRPPAQGEVLRTWKVMGPFPATEPDPADPSALPGRTEWKDGAGAVHRWKPVETKDGMLAWSTLFNTRDPLAAFATTELDSKEDATVTLQGGSDDTLVLWLNGKAVHRDKNLHAYKADQFQIQVRLRAGRNTLLLRCGNEGGKDWACSVSVLR